ILHFQGGELFVSKTVLLPFSCSHCFGWLCSTAMQSSVITVKHTDTAYGETAHSTQLTL
ncbi:unnamed protein product, partial [Staurois parvus]